MEYDVCGGQYLPRLLGALVSRNLSDASFGQVRSIGLHVFTNLRAPSFYQHHPRQSRFLQPHVLQPNSLSSAQHLIMPATTRSHRQWQLLFALCLHLPHPLRFTRLLTLPHALLLVLFSALLSLSYWHRWKAVQYFYHSLLTRSSQATAFV